MKIAIPISISKTQYYINQAYVDYIASVKGFEPVLITPRNNIVESVARCDGLLLPGGIDLDPTYYGENNYSSYAADPEKDMFERQLLNTAEHLQKPVFGICRGFQLMVNEYIAQNKIPYHRLDFRQNINQHQQTDGLKLERGTFMHFVDVKPSLLYWAGGEANLAAETVRQPINSMHHQALVISDTVRSVGGLIVLARTDHGLTATTADDKKVVCEAFRIIDRPAPMMAVQWHPEELKDQALLENFFKSANQPFVIKQKQKEHNGAQV